MRDVTIYRARAGVLHPPTRPIEIPIAGALIGEVWEHECGHAHRILMVADTPEIRAALASVGIHVQPAEQEGAA